MSAPNTNLHIPPARQELPTGLAAASFEDIQRYDAYSRVAEMYAQGARVGEVTLRDFVSLATSPPDLSEASRIGGVALADGRMVEKGPNLMSQLTDPTRTSTFYFFRGQNMKKRGPMAEHTGLQGLDGFLELVRLRAEDGSFPDQSQAELYARRAERIQSDLCFIGEKEFQTGVRGIAEYWKGYLGEDPRNAICIITEIGKLPRYMHKKPKSDDYVKRSILSQFSADDMGRHDGRIYQSIRDLKGSPAHTKIILLDDWTLSGGQLRSEYARLASIPKAQIFLEKGCVEVNLLAAAGRQIESGLIVPGRPPIPIKAYYEAKDSHDELKKANVVISGLHSATNHGMRYDANAMAELTGLEQPAITRIASTRY